MYIPEAPLDLTLVLEAQRELRLLNNALADLIRVHKRTFQRWLQAGAGVMPTHLEILAAAVWTTNPDLARRLAAQAHTSVEALGLVASSPPAAAAAPAPAPSRVASREQAELVVYAAANVLDLPPRVVLPAMAAALRRAVTLGLDLGGLVQALESSDGQRDT
jgi:hypothetical protein